MAKEPGQEKSLHELRQEIAHSRDRLARDLERAALRARFSAQVSEVVPTPDRCLDRRRHRGGRGLRGDAGPRRKRSTCKAKTDARERARSRRRGFSALGLAMGALQTRGDSAQAGAHEFHFEEGEQLRGRAPARQTVIRLLGFTRRGRVRNDRCAPAMTADLHQDARCAWPTRTPRDTSTNISGRRPAAGASDIHLGVNAPPIWRLHGTLAADLAGCAEADRRTKPRRWRKVS